MRSRWLRTLSYGGALVGLYGLAVGVLLVALPGAVTTTRLPEAPVTAMDLDRGPANNSPQVVADPRSSRRLVVANRLDAPEFGCALQVSADGGRSWMPGSPVEVLPEGAERCYAPEVAFDKRGTLYYLFVGLAGQGNQPVGVYLTTSQDGGDSFGAPRKVLGPAAFGVRMAVDRSVGDAGRIVLAWLQAGAPPPLGGLPSTDNPIMSSYSDDSGATFSTPVRVSDPERRLAVAPALVVGPEHRVHVAYYDLGDDERDYRGLEGPRWDGGPWALVVATSADSGEHFGQGVVVDDQLVPTERVMLIFTMPPPSVVADSRRLCLAWSDARHGDEDVFLRCRAKEGPWQPVRRVNEDPVGSGQRQYLPRIGAAPDGRLDVVYYDRSDGQNALNDLNYTYSRDGGASFAGTQRLTSNSSDVRIGQRYTVVSAQGQVEWGSRLGLLSERRRAVAVWTDTRNSNLPSTDQDLFSGTVAFREHRRVVRSAVAGLVVPVTGLVVLVARRRRRGAAVGP